MGYISFDVDGIQNFVFSSYRPIDVHGASELVKKVREDGIILKTLKEKFSSSLDIIYAAGGSGILECETAKCQEIAKELEQLYKNEVGGSITVAYVEDEEFSSKTFSKLHVIVREKKQSKALTIALRKPITGDPRKYCEACGIQLVSQEKEMEEKLCEDCKRKRKYGRKMRKSLGVEVASSLEDLVKSDGSVSESNSRIVLIYADLNNMGILLRNKAEKVKELKEFSKKIQNIIQNKIKDIVVSHQLSGRFVAPVIGGDDLVLIIPAEATYGVLNDILKINAELQQEGTVFSISIVNAYYKFPIYFMFDYAKKLLREAKSITRRSSRPMGAVNFQYITHGGELSTLEGNERQLTNKPYTEEDFRELLMEVLELKNKGTPKSLLYTIKELIINSYRKDGSPEESLLNIQYFLYRADDNKLPKKWLQSRSDIEKLRNVFFTVRERGFSYESFNRFNDLLELYKIIG